VSDLGPLRPPKPVPPAEPEQHEITRLCVLTGLVLMQHGAESALIETLIRRLGLSLGVERVEAGVFANSIVITTICGARSSTEVRRCDDRGTNMHAVTEVQRAVLDVEAGTLDAAAFRARVSGIVSFHYPRWLLALAIGVSCAAFARLAGADLPSCGVVVVASAAAMYLRLRVARLHFSPVVNFFVSAFAASSIAFLGDLLDIGAMPRIARASCVLFLVPGFPLINGVSDMVKGYWSTGLARLAYATLLAAAAAVGIVLSIALFSRWGVHL
jgi:uncharacterized membrane protein YjjP (DUF1212 family)